jgi:hypothetical protein
MKTGGGVEAAGGVVNECSVTDRRVKAAAGVAEHGVESIGRVFDTAGGVEAAGRVSPSAARPVAVSEPPVVLSKRANTPVAALFAPVVLFKSAPSACCCVGVCGVGKKRPSADGRIEVPILLLLNREPTNCCIICAAREIKKSILSLCCVASGTTAVRWRADSL